MTDSASHDASDKSGRLRGTGTLNPHPERVRDPRFAGSDFFDPRDLLQVRYEMVRLVRIDRVREVALRFLVRLAIRPLVRPTALRVPILPRLPTPRVVRRPSRRFQTRLRFPDRRQTLFSPTQLRRQIVAPNLRAQARVLGLVNRIRLTQQRLDLGCDPLQNRATH